jgi:hypothetical protein
VGAALQVGKRHDMSAGLLIGGKAVNEEATRVNTMNILVATPGALPHGVSCSFLCVLESVPECLTADATYVMCSFWDCLRIRICYFWSVVVCGVACLAYGAVMI